MIEQKPSIDGREEYVREPFSALRRLPLECVERVKRLKREELSRHTAYQHQAWADLSCPTDRRGYHDAPDAPAWSLLQHRGINCIPIC